MGNTGKHCLRTEKGRREGIRMGRKRKREKRRRRGVGGKGEKKSSQRVGSR